MSYFALHDSAVVDIPKYEQCLEPTAEFINSHVPKHSLECWCILRFDWSLEESDHDKRCVKLKPKIYGSSPPFPPKCPYYETI